MTPAMRAKAKAAYNEATRKGLALGVIEEANTAYFALTNAQGNVVWGGEKPPTTEEIDAATKA